MGKWEPATQSQSADQPGVCVRVWCLTSATVSCPHKYIIVWSQTAKQRSSDTSIRPPRTATQLGACASTSSPNSQEPQHPPSRPARRVGGSRKARIVLTLPAILPFSSSASQISGRLSCWRRRNEHFDEIHQYPSATPWRCAQGIIGHSQRPEGSE